MRRINVQHICGVCNLAHCLSLLTYSPACILSFFITALSRGELKEAWRWSDDPESPAQDGEASSSATKARNDHMDATEEKKTVGVVVSTEEDPDAKQHAS